MAVQIRFQFGSHITTRGFVAAFLASDLDKWGRVLRNSGIKAE